MCIASKDCYELPIVILSPNNGEIFPQPNCNQKRYPAIDCMKEPVNIRIEVIDHSNGSLNCLKDPFTSIFEEAKVHFRGQSSLHFRKHQMSLSLQNESTSFFQFPYGSGKKFALHGPFIDGSLMRNHLAHWLFRQTGRYSPRTRHCVLFLKNDTIVDTDFDATTPTYHGIYLMLEKIEYGPKRVGLATLNTDCKMEKGELSGGWAWQYNPLNYGVYSPNIVIDQYQAMFGAGERPILMYPPGKKLNQKMRDYFVDPTTGPLPLLYRYLYENMTSPDQIDQFIDLGSFVDYFLHSEMSLNQDAYRRSTYYFKDRNQPINAGPVWDFNLAYGLGAFRMPNGWIYTPSTFWKRLICNYRFVALLAKRWRQLRQGPWHDEKIIAFINETSAPLYRQHARCIEQGNHNEEIWRTTSPQCANLKAKGHFDPEVKYLIKTVLARNKWIDENISKFYRKLDGMYCDPVGELPDYNCAANGKDAGCLTDPEKYIAAVDFPPIRQPFSGETCKPNDEPKTEQEKPSIDYCWLSAGIYLKDGSITPFCSGYGFCEWGPGAKCKCIKGMKEPSCERQDGTLSSSLPKVQTHHITPHQQEDVHQLSKMTKKQDRQVSTWLYGIYGLGVVVVGIGIIVSIYTRMQRRKGYMSL
jgi:hypothetical protein